MSLQMKTPLEGTGKLVEKILRSENQSPENLRKLRIIDHTIKLLLFISE